MRASNAATLVAEPAPAPIPDGKSLLGRKLQELCDQGYCRDPVNRLGWRAYGSIPMPFPGDRSD